MASLPKTYIYPLPLAEPPETVRESLQGLAHATHTLRLANEHRQALKTLQEACNVE